MFSQVRFHGTLPHSFISIPSVAAYKHTTAELRVVTDLMAHKAGNIYYLTL